MRITYKNREKTKSFKLKDIVAMQVGKMESVRDIETMQPNNDGEEFSLNCLKTINEFYSETNGLEKTNIKEPSWNDFKKSCRREWHILKSKNPYLRSYENPFKGWVLIKLDNDTPKEIFDKIDIQSADRIGHRIDGHNKRINHDTKMIGLKPKGRIEFKIDGC